MENRLKQERMMVCGMKIRNPDTIINIDGEGATKDNHKFKQFEIICSEETDDSVKDHHYYAYRDQGIKYCNKTKERIMREWEILEENLPDSIYVRAYEKRIDILRVVIIGPSGTPYQDGLFFFDIYLPSDYPIHPPKFYTSFDFRVNEINPKKPHHEEWVGAVKNEPSEWYLLKVLLSIQATVLYEDPPYKHISGHGSSDRDTFFVSCKEMLNILANPPNHFEEFVSSHFRSRGTTILTKCRAYVDRWSVKTSSVFTYPSIVDIYLKLYLGFIKKGWNYKAEENILNLSKFIETHEDYPRPPRKMVAAAILDKAITMCCLLPLIVLANIPAIVLIIKKHV